MGTFIRRFFYLFLLFGIVPGGAGQDHAVADPVQPAQSDAQPVSPNPSFVRAFSSADDVRKALHPILDRSIDIIAGPKDDEPKVDTLHSPSADHNRFKRARVRCRSRREGRTRLRFCSWKIWSPGSRQSSVTSYRLPSTIRTTICDRELRSTILVYDSAGKFRRILGKLER